MFDRNSAFFSATTSFRGWAWSSSSYRGIGVFWGRPSWPESWRPAPTDWRGPRASPEALAGRQVRPRRPGRVAGAGLLSLVVTWWSSPIDRANRTRSPVFDQRALVPFGYAAFAFALGVTAGMLMRRTLPAMIATLVVFAGIRLAVTNWIRPYLIAPLRIVSAVVPPGPGNGPSTGPSNAAAAPSPGDWVLSDQTINAAGDVVGQDGVISYGGGRFGILFSPAGDGRMTLGGVGPCPNRFPAQAGAVPGGPPSAAFSQAAGSASPGSSGRRRPTSPPAATGRFKRTSWRSSPACPGLRRVLFLVGAAPLRLRRHSDQSA